MELKHVDFDINLFLSKNIIMVLQVAKNVYMA